MYLKKLGQDYFIYCLGKNGEPLTNQKIYLNVKHMFNDEYIHQVLTLDKQGRVKLGQLNQVELLKAKVSIHDIEFNETWNIINESDHWTQPQEMNIIANESVEIPINFSGPIDQISTFKLSFKKMRANQTLLNLTDKIKIEKSKMGSYNQIILNNLEVGEYLLKLNLTVSQRMQIRINVHQGEYWQENFILQKNRLQEFIATSKSIRIENLKCQQVENDANKHELQIQLDNISPNTRVHILTTQFTSNDTKSLKKLLDQSCINQLSSVIFDFAQWKNHYSNGRNMSDEILYVLNRKHQGQIMGNLLDTPSLLMNKQFLRDTEIIKEVLKDGDKFDRVYLNQADPMARQQRTSTSYQQQQFMSSAPRQQKMKFLGSNGGSRDNINNSIKDNQNFLKIKPRQIFNLKPNEHGMVKTLIHGLPLFSQIYIIVCDNDSVSQRQLSVSKILNTNQEILEKEAETSSILKKDLRQLQIMPQQLEDGSTKGGLIETRQTLTLRKDEQVHLQDATCSKYQIIADLLQIRQVMTLMHGSYNDEMLDNVFLKWHTFSDDEKMSSFLENACHELNLFLARKDFDFFKAHVINYLANKIEWTFVDLYLLARFSNDKRCKREVANILQSTVAFDKLKILEKCLLIEYGIFQQDESLKKRANFLASTLIVKIEQEYQSIQKNTNQHQNTMLIDSILDMQNENKPTIKSIISQSQQLRSDQMQRRRQRRQFQFQEEDEYVIDISDDEDDDQGEDSDSDQNNGEDGLNEGEESYQRIQRSRRMRNRQREFRSRVIQKTSNSLFDGAYNFFGVFEDNQKGPSQFEDLEKTKMYKETHYMKDGCGVQNFTLNEKMFLRDYLQNLSQNDAMQPFISSNFIYWSRNLSYFGFMVLDLPISIATLERYPHSIDSDGKRGIIIVAGSEAIIFKKEIKEGNYKLKNDLIITHKYESLNEPKKHSDSDDNDDSDGSDDDDDNEIKFFVINQIYQCEIAITNVTAKNKKTSLLYQVPNGSLPVASTKYIDTDTVQLNPFQTKTFQFKFYFPEEGSQQHYPTIAFVDDVITNMSEIKTLEVKKKQIIVKVSTFKDMMMLAKTNDEKRKQILLLLTNNYDQILDRNFAFDWNAIKFLMDEDKEFYFKVNQIYYSHFDNFLMINTNHCKALIQTAEQKQNRTQLFEHLKIGRYHKYNGHLFSYILQPVSCPLFEVSARQIYQHQFNHLEFFPIINTRVFQIGQSNINDDVSDDESLQKHETKNIKNVQLKETYRQFLLLCINQDFNSKGKLSANIQRDLWLRLTYYLLLQDRVMEAYKIFDYVLELQQSIQQSQVNIQSKNLPEKNYQISIDYMQAYFDFQIPRNDGFQTARAIIQKYKSKNFDSFRYKEYFLKLELQLQEFDEQEQIDNFDSLNDKEQEVSGQDSHKNLIPSIDGVEVDDQDGTITIESQNIDQFDVKYYLIDAEILFSRSPFVQNETETFSYVKPFLQKNVDVEGKSEKTHVQLPEQLNHKNVIIEIKSNDIQRFVQYYSCNLQVQVQKKIGELRVFKKSQKQALSQVYVKVFVQMNNGKSVFFKDGFTDIRGKFEYAKTSSSSTLKTYSFRQFAIFVCHAQLGSMIKTIDARKVHSEAEMIKKK